MKKFAPAFIMIFPLVASADLIIDENAWCFFNRQDFSPKGILGSLVEGCLSSEQSAVLVTLAVAIGVLAVLFFIFRRRKKNADLPH